MDSSTQHKFAMPPLLARAGVLLVSVVATVIAWVVTPEGLLPIPTKLLSPLSVAFLAFLAAWFSWSYNIWKRDSKWERIKDAQNMGRKLCACSVPGEIMTLHHEDSAGIEAYCCPRCTRFNVVYPNAHVSIADDTVFTPPLPDRVKEAWVNQSQGY